MLTCSHAIGQIAAVFVLVSSAFAQIHGLPWHTVDGGGHMVSSGGSFHVGGTIGQPDASSFSTPISGAGFILVGGFWAVGSTPPDCTLPAFMPGMPGVSASVYVSNGYIDPRRESDNAVDVNQGLNRLTVRFTTALSNDDGTPVSADRFTITDTAGNPPQITGLQAQDDRTFTLELDRIISLQEWTTIHVSGLRSMCSAEPFSGLINIGFLPCDVDGNGLVNPLDLLRFRQYVQGSATPAVGTVADRVDIDRNGSVSPVDLLIFRQLINNVPPATQSWNGAGLPPPP